VGLRMPSQTQSQPVGWLQQQGKGLGGQREDAAQLRSGLPDSQGLCCDHRTSVLLCSPFAVTQTVQSSVEGGHGRLNPA